MSALKVLFMCMSFVLASPCKIFSGVQCVSGVLRNSVTVTLYESVTAKHLKACSLKSLALLKNITVRRQKIS